MTKSVYQSFTRAEWECYRQGAPMTLTEQDLAALHGQMEIVSLAEISDIYLPLSRLLSLYVTASQSLHHASEQFLGKPEPKVPYIIGVAGSVAVGKSLTSRILRALLSRWPNHPSVAVVTTDGFLFPQAVLEKENLTARKGFPESYDVTALLRFLMDAKSGQDELRAPIYSHQHYDVVPNEFLTVRKPDIIILEGLNILQHALSKKSSLLVSDFIDFSIFVDAEIDVIEAWYVNRVLKFSQTVFQDPHSYFHYVTKWKLDEIELFARKIWKTVNEKNLIENILPCRNRAHLILKKNNLHRIEMVELRKL